MNDRMIKSLKHSSIIALYAQFEDQNEAGQLPKAVKTNSLFPP